MGRVAAHAMRILRASPQRTLRQSFVWQVPMSAPDMDWVMLTGLPSAELTSTAAEAAHRVTQICRESGTMVPRCSAAAPLGMPVSTPVRNVAATIAVMAALCVAVPKSTPMAVPNRAIIFCPSLLP